MADSPLKSSPNAAPVKLEGMKLLKSLAAFLAVKLVAALLDRAGVDPALAGPIVTTSTTIVPEVWKVWRARRRSLTSGAD